MSNAIDISEVSLKNQLRAIEIIGHNIANANVAGYKRDRLVLNNSEGLNFERALLQANEVIGTQNLPVFQQSLDLRQGSLEKTGSPLNFAIEGDGLFVVQTPQGVAYSRAGNMGLDSSGRLLLNMKYPVLSDAGEVLMMSGAPKVNQNGEIYEGDKYIGKLRVAFFDENSDLQKMGESILVSREPLEELTEDLVSIRQGFLESSNIQQVDEVVQMMKINRQVEMTQRIIRGYDEMLSEAVSTIAEF